MSAPEQWPSGPEDASRRTYLANERTYLAWWRTALAAIAVALAVGRVLPPLLGAARWPFIALGAVWAVLGVALALYGLHRQREVRRALAEGRYSQPSEVALTAFSLVCAGLAIAVLVLILAAS